VTDWAPLARQTGITVLALSVTEPADLERLATFPDLTSLRLYGYGSEGVTDLRPLARLSKVTWLRVSGFPELTDLSPLAEMPELKGINLSGCGKLSDLGPLAKMPGLTVLRIYSCHAVKNLAPLAKLTKLKVLDLRFMGVDDLEPLAALTQLAELGLFASGNAMDLAPLRPLIRRGLDLRVPEKLQPQLDKLRDTDF